MQRALCSRISLASRSWSSLSDAPLLTTHPHGWRTVRAAGRLAGGPSPSASHDSGHVGVLTSGLSGCPTPTCWRRPTRSTPLARARAALRAWARSSGSKPTNEAVGAAAWSGCGAYRTAYPAEQDLWRDHALEAFLVTRAFLAEIPGARIAKRESGIFRCTASFSSRRDRRGPATGVRVGPITSWRTHSSRQPLNSGRCVWRLAFKSVIAYPRLDIDHPSAADARGLHRAWRQTAFRETARAPKPVRSPGCSKPPSRRGLAHGPSRCTSSTPWASIRSLGRTPAPPACSTCSSATRSIRCF